MAAKALLPNQHVPLHFIYGKNDCCLCGAKQENIKLKEIIEDLIDAMEMQEQRELGTFHVTRDVAWDIWTKARDKGKEVLNQGI